MAADLVKIESYLPEKYNVLMPTQCITQISPLHAIRVTEIKADLGPDTGDVFKVGSRLETIKEGTKEVKKWINLFTPAKPLLMRMMQAAGIVLNPASGITTVTRDYVCYKALGAIRLPDGSWLPLVATKELDLTVIEEELREQYVKKSKNSVGKDISSQYKGDWRKYEVTEWVDGKEKTIEKNGYFLPEPEQLRYVDAMLRTNMIQWRKTKTQRAETGAILRLVRSALGLKGQYTEDEMKKPFIIPRLDFSPDLSDPDIKKLVVANGLRSLSSLFGGSGIQVTDPVHAPVVAPEYEDDDETIDVVHSVSESAATVSPSAMKEAEVVPEEKPTVKENVTVQPEQQSEVHHCVTCGAAVSEKAVKFCMDKRGGKIECFKCQRGGNA